MGQYLRRERTAAPTDGRIDGFLIALCTLVIGSARKRPGDLVPSFAILRDRFKEGGILLRCPTTCMKYKEGKRET